MKRHDIIVRTVSFVLSCLAAVTLTAAPAERARLLAEYREAKALSVVNSLTGFLLLPEFFARANDALWSRGADDRPAFLFVSFSGPEDGLHRINEVAGHIAGNQSIVDFSSLVRRTFAGEGRIFGYQGSSGMLVYVPNGDGDALLASVAELKRRWHDAPYVPLKGGPAITNAALHVAWGFLPESGVSVEAAYRKARSAVTAAVVAKRAYSLDALPAVSRDEAAAQELAFLRDEAARLRDQRLRVGQTGVYRLTPFIEKMRERLPAARECRTLVAMDGDRFSQVNIRHGPTAANQVVVEFGKVLRRRFPESETNLLSNSGECSDEFYLFLSGRPSAAAVKEELDGLLADVRALSFTGATGETYRVTFSAGVYVLPQGEIDSVEAFREADLALYAAKDAGRDRVVVREAAHAK